MTTNTIFSASPLHPTTCEQRLKERNDDIIITIMEKAQCMACIGMKNLIPIYLKDVGTTCTCTRPGSWALTHNSRFWPTWALIWDINSIHLYRTCYNKNAVWGGGGGGCCPIHYSIYTFTVFTRLTPVFQYFMSLGSLVFPKSKLPSKIRHSLFDLASLTQVFACPRPFIIFIMYNPCFEHNI